MKEGYTSHSSFLKGHAPHCPSSAALVGRSRFMQAAAAAAAVTNRGAKRVAAAAAAAAAAATAAAAAAGTYRAANGASSDVATDATIRLNKFYPHCRAGTRSAAARPGLVYRGAAHRSLCGSVVRLHSEGCGLLGRRPALGGGRLLQCGRDLMHPALEDRQPEGHRKERRCLRREGSGNTSQRQRRTARARASAAASSAHARPAPPPRQTARKGTVSERRTAVEQQKEALSHFLPGRCGSSGRPAAAAAAPPGPPSPPLPPPPPPPSPRPASPARRCAAASRPSRPARPAAACRAARASIAAGPARQRALS